MVSTVTTLTVLTIATAVSTPANAATVAAAKVPVAVTAAVGAADRAGFAGISQEDLRRSAPISGAALTPDMLVKLGTSGPSYIDLSSGVAVTGPQGDGSVDVVKAGASGFGFGIVTDRHGHLRYAYQALLAPGTRVAPARDGGLDQLSAAGKVLAQISPAYAVDSTGRRLPASYSFNSRTDELIVTADTSRAIGTVFIDPSWKCIAEASAYGVLWVVAAAAWLWSDGTVAFLVWALRAWYGLSAGAADHVAQACAL